MNNKQLGTEWEREFCKILEEQGFWVHFITPDKRGSQPFDIIAVKNGLAYAFECKTLNGNVKTFPKYRIEINQQMAFQKWLDCGNNMPYIAIKRGKTIHIVPWEDIRDKEKVDVINY